MPIWYALWQNACGIAADLHHIFQLARLIPNIWTTATPRSAIALETWIFLTNLLTAINEPDNSLHELKSIDIDKVKNIWSIFIFWKKKQLIAFNQQTSFFQLLFLNGKLGKVFVFIKSCNHLSLYVIMHLWFKKTYATIVSQTCTKPTKEFFSLRCPNSLVNVI